MAIEIDIDADAIQKEVVEAIMRSSLGDSLKKEIDEQVDELSKGYKSPWKQTVATIIMQEARRVVEEDYDDQIRALVREKLTDESIRELVGALISAWLEKSRQ